MLGEITQSNINIDKNDAIGRNIVGKGRRGKSYWGNVQSWLEVVACSTQAKCITLNRRGNSSSIITGEKEDYISGGSGRKK